MIKLAKIPNLTELTYRSIKQHVLEGTHEVNARLTEESLAKQLGISKSPVREALNRLESEGLICIEARRGAYVRQFSAKETSDLYDLREVLEVHAIGQAKITSKLLSDLSKSIHLCEKLLSAGDKSKYVAEDIRFHGLLASAAANDELCRILDNLHTKILLCRYRSYSLSASSSPAAHTRIYRALEQGNCSEAQTAMQEHIRFVRDRLLESLDEDKPISAD